MRNRGGLRGDALAVRLRGHDRLPCGRGLFRVPSTPRRLAASCCRSGDRSEAREFTRGSALEIALCRARSRTAARRRSPSCAGFDTRHFRGSHDEERASNEGESENEGRGADARKRRSDRAQSSESEGARGALCARAAIARSAQAPRDSARRDARRDPRPTRLRPPHRDADRESARRNGRSGARGARRAPSSLPDRKRAKSDKAIKLSTSHVIALAVAQQALDFLEGTSLKEAFDEVVALLESSLPPKSFVELARASAKKSSSCRTRRG